MSAIVQLYRPIADYAVSIAHSRLRVDEADCHRELRCIDGLVGDTEFDLALRPTFGFACREPDLALAGEGAGVLRRGATAAPDRSRRFCWLRHASLVLDSLMSIGYHDAAMDFFRWLEGLALGKEEGLQIMYRLNGSRELPEVELRHLSGYRGSAPVRVGNAAASQNQLDTYGHVIDASFVCLQGMQAPVRGGWLRTLGYLADQACTRWRGPDQGF